MIPSTNASSSARSRTPRIAPGAAGARGGVSLRGLGVRGRIDVGCAMSVVESRQIAATEMRSVIMEGGGGGGGGGVPQAPICAWGRARAMRAHDAWQTSFAHSKTQPMKNQRSGWNTAHPPARLPCVFPDRLFSDSQAPRRSYSDSSPFRAGAAAIRAAPVPRAGAVGRSSFLSALRCPSRRDRADR